MAEFPGFGRHCGVDPCNQLDFLPIRCDACKKTFCNQHFTYDKHSCDAAYQKNVQVPVCPLCSQPVPTPRNSLPDVTVNEHILRQCQADPAVEQRRRIYTNRCSFAGCKKKELIPIQCPKCTLNYCIRHRHDVDHNCQGKDALSKSALAAIARAQKTNPGQCARQASFFPRMSSANTDDDEALARALAESLNGLAGPSRELSPEELDRQLAEQLQQQEYDNRNGQRSSRPQQAANSNCSIS